MLASDASRPVFGPVFVSTRPGRTSNQMRAKGRKLALIGLLPQKIAPVSRLHPALSSPLDCRIPLPLIFSAIHYN